MGTSSLIICRSSAGTPATGCVVPLSASTKRTPYPPTNARTRVRSANGCGLTRGRSTVAPQAPAADGHGERDGDSGELGAAGAALPAGDRVAPGLPGWL